MAKRTVCVIGGGGREHALVYVLGKTADVIITPGNPGIPGATTAAPEDIEADLFVFGPEAPLVDGLSDRLRAAGKLVFGPNQDGAQLEGSKAWMKDLLRDAGVPTAEYVICTTVNEAEMALTKFNGRAAIKTDGLAAGKGVFVTTDYDDGLADARAKLTGASFGEAGKKIVIEQLLESSDGHAPAYELSIMAVCNGRDYVLMDSAQDYKRLENGNRGAMTGGVGCYSPTRDQKNLTRWAEICIRPVLNELRKRGIDYHGVLYAGLMIVDGEPKVLEFNVRFGDPEMEPIAMRLTSDFAELLRAAAAGETMSQPVFSNQAAVTVVLSAAGYPTNPQKGDIITGVEEANAMEGVQVFCAGVGKNDDGKLITAGGRVLAVTALGDGISAARNRAYAAVDKISWDGMQFRSDIAVDA